MVARAFGSVVVVCVFFTGTGRAQPPTGHHTGIFWNYGYPYGPRVAPEWHYYGLTGGENVTYASPPAKHSKSDPVDPSLALVRYSIFLIDFDANGLCLYGPRVPVYGPLPTVTDSKDLKREWLSMNHPNLAGYGWFGLYSALPRPKHVSVSSWPVPKPGDSPGTTPTPTPASAPAEKSGGGMTITVKVPQSDAELLSRTGNHDHADGHRSHLRVAAARSRPVPYKYTVTVRQQDPEDGQPLEKSQTAVGTRGGTVQLDFGK